MQQPLTLPLPSSIGGPVTRRGAPLNVQELRVWSTAEEGKFPASNGAPRLIGPLNGGGSEGAAVTYLLRRFVRYSFKPTRFHSMSVSTASLLASLLASSKARVQDRTKLSLQVAANSCSQAAFWVHDGRLSAVRARAVARHADGVASCAALGVLTWRRHAAAAKARGRPSAARARAVTLRRRLTLPCARRSEFRLGGGMLLQPSRVASAGVGETSPRCCMALSCPPSHPNSRAGLLAIRISDVPPTRWLGVASPAS